MPKYFAEYTLLTKCEEDLPIPDSGYHYYRHEFVGADDESARKLAEEYKTEIIERYPAVVRCMLDLVMRIG